jgi:hypothetical protein
MFRIQTEVAVFCYDEMFQLHLVSNCLYIISGLGDIDEIDAQPYILLAPVLYVSETGWTTLSVSSVFSQVAERLAFDWESNLRRHAAGYADVRD